MNPVEAVSVCEAPAPCRAGWAGPHPSCYKVLPPVAAQTMRRRSGAQQCEDAGAALVAIDDAAENQIVQSVLETALFDLRGTWNLGKDTVYGWIGESQFFSNYTDETHP